MRSTSRLAASTARPGFPAAIRLRVRIKEASEEIELPSSGISSRVRRAAWGLRALQLENGDRQNEAGVEVGSDRLSGLPAAARARR